MVDRWAFVVGVTGTTGYTTAHHLLDVGWEVHGLSRRPAPGLDGVVPVHVDVLDREATAATLKGGGYTHVFFNIWIRPATEDENRRVNSAIVANVLDALRGEPVEHVALVTGLKHYLGPFERYAEAPAATPFREDQARLEFPNFYYDQEDVLFEAAARDDFTWSVHRAHTVIGWGPTNSMNMGATLAAYAAICREATDPHRADEALNIVNGDVFRWKCMWEVVADVLEVDPAPYPGQPTPLEQSMAGTEPIWDDLVARNGLVPNDLATVATWWHTDADLGRPIEAFADMTKSRALGFQSFRRTDDTFRDTFAELKAAKIVPY